MTHFGKTRASRSRAIFTACVVVVCLQLLACSRSTPKQAATFTLESGVTVTEQTDCSPPAQSTLSILKKAKHVYEIKLSDVFDCNARIQPYLTEPVDNKATLVLTLRTHEKSGFSTSCECGRNVSVTIADRLEPGDVLYVLSDSRVIGHLSVPQE